MFEAQREARAQAARQKGAAGPLPRLRVARRLAKTASEFGTLLRRLALSRGLGSDRFRIQVVGDGAEWNANIARDDFPGTDVVFTCDFYHACRTDIARSCKQSGKHWRFFNAAVICALTARFRSRFTAAWPSTILKPNRTPAGDDVTTRVTRCTQRRGKAKDRRFQLAARKGYPYTLCQIDTVNTCDNYALRFF